MRSARRSAAVATGRAAPILVAAFAAFVVGGAPVRAAAPASDDLLSLYALAHAANPELRRAEALADAARAGVGGARAALLPQWRISATPQRSDGVVTRTATSQVTQQLVDLAALSNWRAAREDANVEAANLRAAQQTLLAEVAVRYFALLTAQNQLATLAANEAAFAELVRQSEVRVRERLSAPLDVDQARAYFGLAQVATEQAREALADARQAVQQLTGQAPLPIRPLREDLHPAPPQPGDPGAWVEVAMTRHPLLRAGSAAVAAAQARVSAARSAHLPTLGLAFTTERAPLNGLPAGPQSTNNVLGLQLTVPLLAGGATSALRRQNAFLRDAEAARLESTRRELVRSIEAQWRAAQGSIRQIATAEAAAMAAARALEATRAGQQHGTRDLTDVLNAIQTNGQAQLQLSQARHRHIVALLLLKQSAGSLGIDDLVSANALLAPALP